VAGVVVVVFIAAAVVLVAWRRRQAPVPIGEGIRALGRVGQFDNMPILSRASRSARRRRQVRFGSSLCLALVAVAWLAGSHHRAWAVAFALVLVLRVAFEMLARRP
jgi:hypothetical protein